MSVWQWNPPRTDGIWRYGASALRPLVAAAPWLTVILLTVMFFFLSRPLTIARGTLFDLPSDGLAEGETTDLVAVLSPVVGDTLIFFDDARYHLGDGASSAAFSERLAEFSKRRAQSSLLVLADRRISSGELMKFSAIARISGISKVLFAAKSEDAKE